MISVADDVSGSATLLDLNEEVIGLLSPRPFSHGTMKVAYDVSVLYIHFYHIY